MEGYCFGYPRRNYNFSPYSNPNPNPNPNNYWNPYHHSNPNPNHYLNPYHNPNPNPNPNPSLYHNANARSKPRVVSIPIHYVNSDSATTPPPRPQIVTPVVPPRPSPETAAVKLQKIIRGFLVRKNLRIVRNIESEAEAIGREIERDEMVLEKEVKARIRIGEMLMNLLFRLDSVRGVRDYRKKVIRKVIFLQELVDSIGARGDKVKSETIEVERPDDVVVDSVELTVQNRSSIQSEESMVEEPVNTLEETPVDATDSSNANNFTEQGTSSGHLEDDVVESVDLMEESPIEPTKSTETSQMEELGEKSNSDEEFTEAQEVDEVYDPTETLESDEMVKRSNVNDQTPDSSQVEKQSNEMEMKGVRDVMERVVVESEKMKNLMEELCQRSAQQWRLMEGLVDRVQRLEKEVERMERKGKKKRRGNGRRSDSLSKKCSQ